MGLFNYATLLMEQRSDTSLIRAASCLQQALVIYRSAFGESHPLSASSEGTLLETTRRLVERGLSDSDVLEAAMEAAERRWTHVDELAEQHPRLISGLTHALAMTYRDRDLGDELANRDRAIFFGEMTVRSESRLTAATRRSRSARA